jgi:hypothetical protein
LAKNYFRACYSYCSGDRFMVSTEKCLMINKKQLYKMFKVIFD